MTTLNIILLILILILFIIIIGIAIAGVIQEKKDRKAMFKEFITCDCLENCGHK